MSASRAFHTFALVVFGGRIGDTALATDFVMISKKFMEDGLQPTCLSARHLETITDMSGPFLFGREDLGRRVQIYDSQEARSPFYRLDTHGVKSHALAWARGVSRQVSPGDRIVIVLMGHGRESDGAVVFYPQHAEREYLSKVEMTAALSVLPPHVRLLIVNEACYSGTWATIATDIGSQRDVLVETAATVGEQSWNYISGSGRNRCTLFGAAFVEELTTYPEGRISHHRRRIVDEMLHVQPDQKTSTPLVIPSARALLSHNISHFILTPKIATAIMDVASEQHRHEALLRSRTSARSLWGRFRRWMGPERGQAQALADGDSADMKSAIIKKYISDLGPLGAALGYSTLINTCQYALEGRGPPDLKDQVIATIAWQQAQMLRVSELLHHLAGKGLITDIVEKEVAKRALKDRRDEMVLPIAERLFDGNKLDCLCDPPAQGHVGVFYDDPQSWLIAVLAYNRLMHEEEFDLDSVEKEVVAFLASS
ncbi:hypothetical protein ASPZODRAFT_76708 [Penicilliopsis zonata CBS 506.65]|uniref:Uncharacterized protein n=1 Tax=Penicilliopsis zonata CBS 506.65 TaxID=1073090 RepID=A0A1L9S5K0_9EURO|nr:hypothetical protein ASPZODRAFT_76708 [Penicilliopsis zonata CBS 506.65]OJJ42434.1 hypothetical protein ASPZODRAFT_76708 [Penicilliopsis zonata CBS 506.65]